MACESGRLNADDYESARRSDGVMVGTRSGLLLALTVGTCVACTPRSEWVRVERSVALMGTIARFVAEAPDRARALESLEQMVATVEDVEAEISTWRDDSVLGRLNRQPVGDAMLLPSLSCDVLDRAAHWWREADGAFDPAVGRLVEAWGLRGDGHRPGADELDAALLSSGLGEIGLTAEGCSAIRRADVSLDAGAFGKGAALDEVRRVMADVAGAWMADLGGQVAVGPGAWPVALAHPLRRDQPAMELELSGGSLATSGGSERDLVLKDGSRVGHVLDPRTGIPVTWRGSVAVWSHSALDADALSTALRVMGPEAGFDWAVDRRIAACFFTVGPDGELMIRATPEFRRRFRAAKGR